MADGQLVSQVWLTGFPKTFVFKFVAVSNTVYVAVPIIDNNGAISSTSEPQQTIALSLVQDGAYYGLKSVDSSSDTSMSLSVFNILNDFSNGKFYTVMDTTSMTTLLIAKVHYQFTRDLGVSTGAQLFSPGSFAGLSATSGDVLCWGSQSGYGFVLIMLFSFKHTCVKAYHCGHSWWPRYSSGCSSCSPARSLPKSTSVASGIISGRVGACTPCFGFAMRSGSHVPRGLPSS
jgi:hypothetical protein